MKPPMPLLLRGDARHLPLPDGSVDLIVTSPPYFALRDYGTPGQIGSEPTPAEFLDALLACTAEMARVLKPSGSIFVNLGDRFSGGERFDNEFTIEDAAWLGGVIDSDGSISIHKQGTSYTAWTRVGQMRPEVVRRIADVTDTGTVSQDGRGCWHWQAAAQQAAEVLRRIWPWLHIKRRQAFAAVELQERKAAVGGKGRWNALTDAELAHRERIRQAVLAWNRGDAHDYDPPLLPLPDLPLTARRIPQKSLSLLPERYRVRCVDELGLIARAVIIWDKPNSLPESVRDRVRRSHEDWVHLTKQPRYYSAVDEIREPASDYQRTRSERATPGGQRPRAMADACNPLGKLPGTVWTIATQPLNVPGHIAHADCCDGRPRPGCEDGLDHYAAYPMEWPRRLVSGWCPREVCTACGEGRRPVVAAVGLNLDRPQARRAQELAEAGGLTEDHFAALLSVGLSDTGRGKATQSGTGKNTPEVYALADQARAVLGGYAREYLLRRPTSFRPQCACPDTTAPATPGVVLDPFGGTGTTALVTTMLGRRGISVELAAQYQPLASWRCCDSKERARAAGLDPDAVSAIRPTSPDQLDLWSAR